MVDDKNKLMKDQRDTVYWRHTFITSMLVAEKKLSIKMYMTLLACTPFTPDMILSSVYPGSL